MTLRTPRTLLAMRTLGPLCLLSMIAAPIPAGHAQEQLWLRQFGTRSRDEVRALAPDGVGGVMVAGITKGSLGGPNAGSEDAFLARYDSAGDRLWIHQFGTSEDDRAWALAPDGAGGVIVAGDTMGSLGGPYGGGIFVADAYLARYDSAGSRLWIRQFGGSSSDRALALAPDGAGGVIVAGDTGDSLGGPNAGNQDVFLARYDEAGNRLWIRQFGTEFLDQAWALAPDGAGGMMVAGETGGNLGRPNPNPGRADVFVARYDGAGNQLWIRQFGTREGDAAYALAPDGAGGVMVTGNTLGSLGGPNAGGSDVFLARYDGAGNQLWVRHLGTSAWDPVHALATDGAGGVLVAGHTGDDLGGPSAGDYDVFLARYDGAGNQLWIHQFGTSRLDYAYALAPGGAAHVFLAGLTQGSLGGPNAGFFDAFLARYTTGVCPCACDFDTSTGPGVCDIVDFTIFAGLFAASDPCACDLDTSTGPGVCDIVDFVTFAGQFAGGCP